MKDDEGPYNISHIMNKPKAHFIGIGGIGVSSLARYFLAQSFDKLRIFYPEYGQTAYTPSSKLGIDPEHRRMGQNWLISGSDVSMSNELAEIRRDGAKVQIGHRKSNITPDMALVVYSQAIPMDNPEILEAKRLKLALKSYPQVLGDLTRTHKTLAVAGSHGKSTTTALLGLIFLEAGIDPTVIIGTKLKEFGGRNFRLGKSEYLIIEADEYKDSFLNYHFDGAIITNVDREHLDHYKNFAGVKKGFTNFMRNANQGGILVLNKDDKSLPSLSSKAKNKRVIWYSLRDVKRVKQIKKVLQIPGEHNISNALAAYNLAKSFGIKEKVILKALSKYRGAWRRMEYKGEFKARGIKAKVYDDYGHHPTEIKATLKAFRSANLNSPLVCVFQPHQSKRLKILFKEFTDAFGDADLTLIMPIYRVAGRDVKPDQYDAEALVNAARKKHPKQKIFYLKEPKNLKNALGVLLSTFGDEHCEPSKVIKKPGNRLKEPVIVMMGAGDIVNLTPKLLK